MRKLVLGIGVSDKYPTHFNGKITEEYRTWYHMLERCTERFWDKNKTYLWVSCSENFKSYAFFHKWYNEQRNSNKKDEKGKKWQLDKDLLIKGNKLYSEDTCVFVPKRINLLLVKRDAWRGDFPIGVNWNKRNGKFVAQCCAGNGTGTFLGHYDSKENAFHAYKVFKEGFIRLVAEEYRDQLDTRAYEALLNYVVDIGD